MGVISLDRQVYIHTDSHTRAHDRQWTLICATAAGIHIHRPRRYGQRVERRRSYSRRCLRRFPIPPRAVFRARGCARTA